MIKKKSKTQVSVYLFLSISVYIFMVVVNYALGFKQIQLAHLGGFTGGICYGYPEELPICLSRYGFDFYFLLYGLAIYVFVISCLSVITLESFKKSFFYSFFVSTMAFLATGLLVKLPMFPILYTHFMEMRQSFTHELGLLRLESLPYILVLVLFICFAGNLVGTAFNRLFMLLSRDS